MRRRKPKHDHSRFDQVIYQTGISYDYHAADAHRVFVHQFGDADLVKLAELFGYSAYTVRAWRRGDTPIPVAVYRVCQMLREGMPPCAGSFRGWQFRQANGRWRIVQPGQSPEAAVSIEDLHDWPLIQHERMQSRTLGSLVARQAELIETLHQRIAYLQRVANLETRMGLMLQRIVLSDDADT